MNETDPDRDPAPAPGVPLAIVGIGCMFPGAPDRHVYWTNLRDGVDAITDVPTTHWDPSDYYDPDPKAADKVYARRGGFLSPVEVSPRALGIAPRDIEATDTTQMLALVAAAQALEDAGYGAESDRGLNRDRASVILGVTGALELVIPLGARLGQPMWRKALAAAGVDPQTAEDVVERIAEQYPQWQENSFPGLLGNVAAGRIANRLDLHGTNCVVDAACASSLSALHLAALELQTGRADLVLAGGVDTFNDVFMYACFSKTPALSPTGDARPFDREADGTILGEGVGVVTLKRLSDARRDGDRVYAVVSGIGSSSDGRGQAIYAPDSEGQARALRSAYANAGVPPRSVELIEAHGTGTKVGDATEVRGLASVFGDPEQPGETDAPRCALGSVKSMIGHTKAAAGVAGLIKVALSLHHRVLPPTLKVSAPSEAIEGPFYVSRAKRPWLRSDDQPRRAGVSAFGFGGSNFHCVLTESDQPRPAIAWDGDTQIVAMSATSRSTLAAAMRAVGWPEAWADARRLAAGSRETFDPGAPCRMTLVVRRGDDVAACLDAVATAIESDGRARWTTAQGVAFAEGAKRGKVAALLPGQGAQVVDMLRDLACESEAMRSALGEVLAQVPGVAASVYPVPAWTDEAHDAQRDALRATEVAQPALGAVSVGAWAVLEHLGVRVDAAVGHSYGELAALCLAGRIEREVLGRLSRQRGEAMAGDGGDRGTMLAVLASPDVVEDALAGAGIELTFANFNGPKQVVLSGRRAALQAAEVRLRDQGLDVRRLDVAAAFHSPLVADAREPFAAAVAPLEFPRGRFPVYANVDAKPYPEDAAECRARLVDQLVSPVQFVRCIEAMVADGIDTFVEVGPGRRLSGLVESIADDVVTVAVDASAGRRPGMVDVARTLGALAVFGHAANLRAWDPDAPPARKKEALTVSVCGANHKPRPEPRPPRVAVPAAEREQRSAKDMSKPVDPTPVAPPAANVPAVSGNAASHAAAVQTTADNLAALMRLQQQTAELHQRFLEGQQHATQAFAALAAQQQGLLGGSVQAGVLPPVGALPTMPTAPAVPTMPSMPTAPPTPAVAARPAAAAAPVSRTSDAPPTLAVATPSVGSDVAAIVLEIVADKTGYPLDMLELTMGLDADLGIDSIKRVEILSALRERLPDAPAIGPEQLGTLQTMGDIVDFLGGGSRSAVGTVPATAAPTPAPAAGHASTTIAQTLLEVVADKTGYPVETLELSMGMDADLGIDSIKRVEILSVLRERLPHAPEIGPEQLGTLSSLGDIVAFLGGESALPSTTPTVVPTAAPPIDARAGIAAKPSPVATPSASAELDRYEVCWHAAVDPVQNPVRAGGPVAVTGPGPLVARVAAALGRHEVPVRILDWGTPLPQDVAGVVVVAPATADDDFARDAFTCIRAAARTLGARKDTWIAGVTQLGGDFGLSGLDSGSDPRAGALVGLLKTAARELAGPVHAIDLSPSVDDAALDAVLAAALLGGPVELGAREGRVGTLALAPIKVHAATPGEGLILGGEDVVLVTGGARGVTAAVALELARQGKPALVLVGRSPEPAEEPTWLQGLRDEAEIKRALAERTSEPVTPRQLAQECHAVLAAREIRATLRAIEATGARVAYRAVDVRDPEAVAALVQWTTRELGPVTVAVHGAGVLADKRLVDKSDDDWARVYDTKARGAANLLDALDEAPLRALVLFGSSTGRFGRIGQADYAAANEVLAKTAMAMRTTRPDVRTVTVDWGPWDGGMVTPALRQMFAAEGVHTIDLAAGARFVVDELAHDGPPEIVVVGAGSTLDGALTLPRAGSTAMPEHPTVWRRELSVADHPFLASHVLDGKAVLPTAMMLEWMAHAALAEHPGLRFVGVDDLRVYRGIRLGRVERIAVRVEAAAAERRDDQFVVPVALCSGGGNGHRIVHAVAEVVLATQTETAPSVELPHLPPFPEVMDRVYDRRLFHGEAFHGLSAIDGLAPEGVVARARSAPSPRSWMDAPVRRRWITDPLAVDSALQAVIVWTDSQRGAPALPQRLGRYRQFEAFPEDGARIGVRIADSADHRATANVDWVADDGRLVAQLTDCEWTLDASLRPAFARNRVE